jgi:hypothetical protein
MNFWELAFTLATLIKGIQEDFFQFRNKITDASLYRANDRNCWGVGVEIAVVKCEKINETQIPCSLTSSGETKRKATVMAFTSILLEIK